MKHEAGHFLIAYLMGVLPKAFTLSAAEALSQYGALNVQAGCTFCEEEMQQEARGKGGWERLAQGEHASPRCRFRAGEGWGCADGACRPAAQVRSGKISAGAVERFACIALAARPPAPLSHLAPAHIPAFAPAAHLLLRALMRGAVGPCLGNAARRGWLRST